ncbi:MAG TPA: hypothetical protein DCX41_12150 [Aequorivita sp.]|nr:hypothetical protein [Aequorivita sp.]|tara:strand:+ start:1772 stop:1957 length:186 start_codon:yes stop_codon:yes gene_type:complete
MFLGIGVFFQTTIGEKLSSGSNDAIANTRAVFNKTGTDGMGWWVLIKTYIHDRFYHTWIIY